MKRIVLICILSSIFLLAGCQSAPRTVETDGIARTATEEEQRLGELADTQDLETPEAILAELPERWETSIVRNNGMEYSSDATVSGGSVSDFISFDLVEKTMDANVLKHTLMGEQVGRAVLKDDLSAEGKQYWAILDASGNRPVEELHYYVYDGNVPDFLDYLYDTMIYDDENQTIQSNDDLPILSDDEAVSIAAEKLPELGFAGMTVLNGINYQTEVTFYVIPQYTPLPIAVDQDNAIQTRMKITVSDGKITELCGNGLFREIQNNVEIQSALPFNGILALAEEHLKTLDGDVPAVTGVSLRYRYAYDEQTSVIHVQPVWYFEILPFSVETSFGTGRKNCSFAIDAVDGTLYGGF